jgi:LacI family transcriptional regulator
MPASDMPTVLCKQFIARKISGVFFAPAELTPGQEQANRRLAESLREAGIAVVAP